MTSQAASMEAVQRMARESDGRPLLIILKTLHADDALSLQQRYGIRCPFLRDDALEAQAAVSLRHSRVDHTLVLRLELHAAIFSIGRLLHRINNQQWHGRFNRWLGLSSHCPGRSSSSKATVEWWLLAS